MESPKLPIQCCQTNCPQIIEQAKRVGCPENEISTPTHYQKETIANIRRNVRHMADDLTIGNDRDSRFIDYLNHMDALAQELQNSL